jgi:hypothetical protein
MPDDYETITIQKYYKDKEEEEDPETKSQQYLNPKPILRPPNMSQINPKYSSTFFFFPFPLWDQTNATDKLKVKSK